MKNQKGFTVIEVMLVILVIAVIGFGGYKVWNNTQEDEPESVDTTQTESNTVSAGDNNTEANEQDEAEASIGTADWSIFESTNGWSMKLPDGWDALSHDDNEGFWIGSALEYKQGKPAVVTLSSSGRGGPFALNVGNFATGDPATQAPEYLTDEEKFGAVNVNGKRYSGTLMQDYPFEGSTGDTVYWYVLPGDTKTVIFMHNDFADSNASSVLELLEQAISTFEFD